MTNDELKAADPTLVPPQGAVFGSHISALGPFTQNAQWTDDRTITTQTQAANGSANSQYYVYWVNGAGNPYYVIIQRITGSFAPGVMIATGPNSYGFFQTIVTVSSSLSAPNATVSMIDHSPQTFVSSQGNTNAPVSLKIPMILMLPMGGGWSPQEFDAQEQTSVQVPDWAVLDQTQPSTQLLQTCFHQLTSWDPIAHPASNWPYWYANVYDGNDNTAAPPSFSTGTLQFESIVAWMVTVPAEARDQASPPAPPSLPVSISTSLSQDLAAWHNIAGCLSTFKGSGAVQNISGAHHIQPLHQAFTPYVYSANLQDIVTNK